MTAELPEPVMPGQTGLDFGEPVGLDRDLGPEEYCIPCRGRCTMFDGDEEDCD